MIKLYQIAKSLSKIKHKKYELYVLSRIVHGLNDPGIKFKFQQYAKRNENGKYALIDLFLPQFNIAIEVDEAYHLAQLTEDEVRQNDIEVLNIDVKRVDCSEGIVSVNTQTDRIISEIIKERDKSTFNEWDGLSGYEHYKNKREFNVEDDTELCSVTEICNCFGFKSSVQSGGRNIHNSGDIDGPSEKFLIWWPKENYADSNGEISGAWYNKMVITDEGTIIIHEYALDNNKRREHVEKTLKEEMKKKRIVFYRKGNMFNETLYRFAGVFELDVDNTKNSLNGNDPLCVWIQKETTFKLPEFYNADNLLAQLNGLKDKVKKSQQAKIDNSIKKIEDIKNLYTDDKIKQSLKEGLENKSLTKGSLKNMKKHVDAYKKLSTNDEKEAYIIDNELLRDWKVYKELERNEELMKIDKEIKSMNIK